MRCDYFTNLQTNSIVIKYFKDTIIYYTANPLLHHIIRFLLYRKIKEY